VTAAYVFGWREAVGDLRRIHFNRRSRGSRRYAYMCGTAWLAENRRPPFDSTEAGYIDAWLSAMGT